MDYKNMEIAAEPGVYEPAEDSFLAADMVSKYLSSIKYGKVDVLDVGTGTGILGLTASLYERVDGVTFLDINENALSLAKRNFEKNRAILKATPTFIRSDLFSDVASGQMFGLIIFNAPYLRNEKEGEDGEHNPWSGGKEGVELSIRFLNEASSHIEQDGRIILNASSLSNLAKLREEVEKLGFRIIEERSVHVSFEDIMVFLLARA